MDKVPTCPKAATGSWSRSAATQTRTHETVHALAEAFDDRSTVEAELVRGPETKPRAGRPARPGFRPAHMSLDVPRLGEGGRTRWCRPNGSATICATSGRSTPYGYESPVYGHLGEGLMHCRVRSGLTSEPGIVERRLFLDETTDLVMQLRRIALGSLVVRAHSRTGILERASEDAGRLGQVPARRCRGEGNPAAGRAINPWPRVPADISVKRADLMRMLKDAKDPKVPEVDVHSISKRLSIAFMNVKARTQRRTALPWRSWKSPSRG